MWRGSWFEEGLVHSSDQLGRLPSIRPCGLHEELSCKPSRVQLPLHLIQNFCAFPLFIPPLQRAAV
jgi:hypothetical protein